VAHVVWRGYVLLANARQRQRVLYAGSGPQFRVSRATLGDFRGRRLWMTCAKSLFLEAGVGIEPGRLP
jgi:hypothetical protein